MQPILPMLHARTNAQGGIRKCQFLSGAGAELCGRAWEDHQKIDLDQRSIADEIKIKIKDQDQ